MKQFILGLATALALGGVVALSRTDSTLDARVPADPNTLKIETGDKNPWTSIKLNNDAEQFSFAVMADRTGGNREKVFSQAVTRVNLQQPRFVMSVGDLIQGYTTNDETIKSQWEEFDGYVKKFEMPFFYVPGNHDLANKAMVTKWGERYGKRYYSFTYQNVLFLCLCSENPPDMATIDVEQQEWVAKTVAAHKDVRWTFAFLHTPIWTGKDLEKNGWAAVEQALAGRKYNVFCGHVHRYQVYERNGTQYYQLATTGGGSRLRGTNYGEFDHIAWVTMKKDKPLIANVMTDGILPADLKEPESDEKGWPRKLKLTFPTSGRITYEAKPVANAMVVLHSLNADGKTFARVADGRTDDAGRFDMTTYTRLDGVPSGEYVATIGRVPGASLEPLPLPAMYLNPATSPLKISIRETPNVLNLDLPK